MNTFLKFIVTVVALTALFIGLIMWFDKTKKPGPIASSKPTPAAVATGPAIKDLDVLPAPDGALVKIGEVKSDSYEVVSKDGATEIVIDFPKSGLEVKNKSLSAPHALIQSIDASELNENGKSGSRIKISLAEGATYKSRFLADSLYVDIIQKPSQPPVDVVEEVEVPERTPKPAPVKTPKAPKSNMTASATSKPSIKKTPKPTPKITVKATPKPKTSDQELIDNLLSGGSNSTPPPVIVEPPVAPTNNDPGELLPPSDGTNTPVAMVPPSNSFDGTSKAGLPNLSGLSVVNEGGVTRAYIDRESKTKFKIFKQVNPNRVVVEFLNAASRLQKEYGGFPGTKVQRVTTQQFAGPDGTISRVVFYVEGQPEYDKADNSNGNRFMLSMP